MNIFNLHDRTEPFSSQTIRAIAAETEGSPYTLLYITPLTTELGDGALRRMTGIAQDTSAGIVYADYYERRDDKLHPHPLIDYRKGSVRDDFDFGAFLLFNTNVLREAAADMTEDYRFAGLYDLRLKVSQRHPIVHINEFLCICEEKTGQTAGERQFDYVDPRNREVQVEMEKACTDHLKQTGAFLTERRKTVDLTEHPFNREASVIIPVRNRVRTISQAIRSALEQKTSFPFNVIVVDNHSTDGTKDAIKAHTHNERRLKHILPKRRDLGIGGCWNLAARHPNCGKFAVQLDSDDVYSDVHSLQKIVDAFYSHSCAMVVGSYRLTGFDLQTIPPGVVDHREWTPENGHNNALRINGLGAPRAFYTPLLRSLSPLPNTSYGEDYAACLRICREYAVGRIYDVLYLCRRWEGNSDALPDITTLNAHNAYKDNLRTWEIEARILMNKGDGNSPVE
jgi:hypothetical protein